MNRCQISRPINIDGVMPKSLRIEVDEMASNLLMLLSFLRLKVVRMLICLCLLTIEYIKLDRGIDVNTLLINKRISQREMVCAAMGAIKKDAGNEAS